MYKFILNNNFVYVYKAGVFYNTYPIAWYASVAWYASSAIKKIRISPTDVVHDTKLTLLVALNEIDGQNSNPTINTSSLESAILSLSSHFKGSEVVSNSVQDNGGSGVLIEFNEAQFNSINNSFQSLIDRLNQVNSNI